MTDVARIITGLLIDPIKQKVRRVAFNQKNAMPQLSKMVRDPNTLHIPVRKAPIHIEELSGGYVCVNEIGSFDPSFASNLAYYKHKPTNASFCYQSVILRQTLDGEFESVAPGVDQDSFITSIEYCFDEEPWETMDDEDEDEMNDINSLFLD